MSRPSDRGVILINVLVALALGAALVTLMLTSQDGAIDRTRRAAAMAQAEALALGAESSVLVALRRDMVEAPEFDSLSEPWAAAAQAEVRLPIGRFAVTVRDAQARLDLNLLGGGGVGQVALLDRLVAELGLPATVTSVVRDAVRTAGPLRGLEDVPGLDETARAALDPFVTVRPGTEDVNLNTTDVLVMGVVLGNRSAARRLVQMRDRNGSLDREDLTDLGVVPGAGVGFRSDVWDVEVLAEVDGVKVRLASRLVRHRSTGAVEVVVASRRFVGGGDVPDLTEEE